MLDHIWIFDVLVQQSQGIFSLHAVIPLLRWFLGNSTLRDTTIANAIWRVNRITTSFVLPKLTEQSDWRSNVVIVNYEYEVKYEKSSSFFLGEGVTMGVWRARTSGFYPIAKEDAIKAIQSCSFLEMDPQRTMDDMDPKLYQEAIDAYENDVKTNPDAYKDILNYNGVKMN